MPLATTSLGVQSLRASATALRVHAVLSAAGAPSVLRVVRELGPKAAVSLFDGEEATTLEDVAPYLVRVSPRVLDWLITERWPDPWGVFLLGECAFENLRVHAAQLTHAESPEGKPWHLRYYDPRVLGQFLSTCTDAELGTCFGPLEAFGITDPETYGVTLFRLGTAPRIRLLRPTLSANINP